MYRRILVGIDCGPATMRAVEEAVRLAREQHATLHFVHVVDLRDFYRGSEDFSREYAAEKCCREKGREMLERAHQIADREGIPAETTLLAAEGQRVSEAVVELGRKWNADLIVVGTHGRRGLGRLLLGSVAEGVGRIAPVAVLVVGSSAMEEAH